mgnify:CR=1 FL=1
MNADGCGSSLCYGLIAVVFVRILQEEQRGIVIVQGHNDVCLAARTVAVAHGLDLACLGVPQLYLVFSFDVDVNALRASLDKILG